MVRARADTIFIEQQHWTGCISSIVGLGYTESTAIPSLCVSCGGSFRDDHSRTQCFRAKQFLSDDVRYLGG